MVFGSFHIIKVPMSYLYNTICLPVSVRPRNVDELGTCTHDLVYSHVIILLLSTTTLCVTLHIFCRHIPYIDAGHDTAAVRADHKLLRSIGGYTVAVVALYL